MVSRVVASCSPSSSPCRVLKPMALIRVITTVTGVALFGIVLGAAFGRASAFTPVM
jgi:hypothetical protein